MSQDQHQFMARLAREVASEFPVLPGETLQRYAERAKAAELPAGARALLAAAVDSVSRKMRAERALAKSAWIARARLTFDPGKRQPCHICGKYEGLTEAHHVVPLAVQYEAGAAEPIQEFAWLCPTHHQAEHFFIRRLLKNVTGSVAGMPPEEVDTLHRFGVRFIELLLTLPHWPSVKG